MTVRLAPSADGLYYLLEVSIAKEVLDVWQQCEIVLPRRTRHAGRSSTTPYMTHKSHSLPGTSMAKELGRALPIRLGFRSAAGYVLDLEVRWEHRLDRLRERRPRGAGLGVDRDHVVAVAPSEERPAPRVTRRAGQQPDRSQDTLLRRRGRDSNPRCRGCPHNGFRDRPIQPLSHPSAGASGAT